VPIPFTYWALTAFVPAAVKSITNPGSPLYAAGAILGLNDVTVTVNVSGDPFGGGFVHCTAVHTIGVHTTGCSTILFGVGWAA
jgi:hypothetical protein